MAGHFTALWLAAVHVRDIMNKGGQHVRRHGPSWITNLPRVPGHHRHHRGHVRHATAVSPDPDIPDGGAPLAPPIPIPSASSSSSPTKPLSEYRIASQPIAHQTVTSLPSPFVGLSSEQRALVDTMHEGKNVYFTGRAGTGKSHVLKAFITEAKEKQRRVAVTAPSGIAAVHIGGQTLHSYFSLWPSHLKQPEKLHVFLRQSNWRISKYDVDVVILDEASMVGPDVFNALHYLMLRLRSPRKRDLSKPFGGAQVVLCGDFYQLPPIDVTPRNEEGITLSQKMEQLASQDTPYLFDSAAWSNLMINQMHVTELTKVFRQSDPHFIELLDEMRVGNLSAKSWNALDACRRPLPVDGIIPTRLYAFRRPALHANFRCLEELPGPDVVFDAIDHLPRRDTPALPLGLANALKSSHHWDVFQAEKTIPLRKGAQVILLKNLSIVDGLVNGARGVVIDFQTHTDSKYSSTTPIQIPVVRFTNGKTFGIPYDDFEIEIDNGVILSRSQIPLKLGWALTIHKSQGMTLDRVELSMPVAFACGQAYVALSRVKNLSGLHLKNFHPRAIVASRKVKRFYDDLQILQ
ncbi:hypothetical protein SeLEV6574_g01486 [Synchytrium endobioticum]|nr:hypothetical protein SeLEV6574_g01486 [Synchytrium endobioticum]